MVRTMMNILLVLLVAESYAAITCDDFDGLHKKSDYYFHEQGSDSSVYFNLCGPVKTQFNGFDTSDTSILGKLGNGNSYARLGLYSTEKLTFTEKTNTKPATLQFDYFGDKLTNFQLRSKVIVECSEEDTSSNITARLIDYVYVFSFKSPNVCETVDPFPIVGIILLSILLLFFLIYIIGGILLNKFVFHKEGIELIPHINFWKELPSLLLDGIKFTFCCRKASSQYAGFVDES